MDLLDRAHNVYSQNGEDGVIEAILEAIGAETKWTCEFGAWDGLHFSNTRHLVERGWHALLIEAEPNRYAELVANNTGNARVHTLRAMIDASVHRLEPLLDGVSAPALDLLAIDVDGLDYEIFAALQIRPRVVVVEINAGHSPAATYVLPREIASDNVGQPFAVLHTQAERMGYQLVAYTGNAFYVRRDTASGLPALTPIDAYKSFLAHLDLDARRWLYHVNRGDVPPARRFNNPYLTKRALGLPRGYVGVGVRVRHSMNRIARSLASAISKLSGR